MHMYATWDTSTHLGWIKPSYFVIATIALYTCVQAMKRRFLLPPSLNSFRSEANVILDDLPLHRSSFTDINRPIRLRLSTADGVMDDLLLVKHVSGGESICGGVDYSLLCLSNRAGMKLKRFIANPF